MKDTLGGLLRGLTDAINNVITAFATYEVPEKGDLIAMAGLGVALAAVALQSSLQVELQRAEFAVNHPGREHATAVSRVSQLTTSFLLAGALNILAASVAGWPWGNHERLMWATAFALVGYGLFLLAYSMYLLNIHVFDPLAKVEAIDALRADAINGAASPIHRT